MLFFDYPGHLIAIVLLVLFAVGIVFAYLSRRLAGAKLWALLLALLQYSAIVILLLILWNPSTPKMNEQTVRNSVMVFFDTSQSMSVIEDQQTDRLDKAITIFREKFLSSRDESPEYKFFGFSGECYNADSIGSLRKWGQRTNLHNAIARISKYKILDGDSALDGNNQFGTGRPVGAVIFTDGQAEDKNVNAYLSSYDKDLQVVIVGIGQKDPQSDIMIKSIKTPLQVGINTSYKVQVAVTAKHLQAGTVVVELLKDGYFIDSKEVPADLLTNETIINFIVGADELGRHIISARASGTVEEVNTTNNVRQRIVEVIESTKLKVLFYSQVANFNIGKVRQALAADKKIDLDFGLDAIVSPDLSKKSLSACGHVKLPKDAQGFYKYDIIVLGPCVLDNLTAEQADGLYSFVIDRGGGLILLPGNGKYGIASCEKKKLVTLIPAIFEQGSGDTVSSFSGQLELTLEGTGSNILTEADLQAQDTSCSPYYNNISRKPAATTLLQVSKSPVLCAHRVGRGKVCIVNASRLNQWYRQNTKGGLLGKFMAGLTTYIGTVSNLEATVEIFAERKTVNPDTVQFEAYVRDSYFADVADATVLLTVGENVVRMEHDTDGRYIAQISQITDEAITATVQAQRNEVFLGEKTIAANLPLPLTEMDNIELDKKFLKALAKRLDGEYFDGDDVAEDMSSMFNATTQVNSLTNMISVWPKWSILLALCLVLTIGWSIRRAIGLV